MLVLSNKHHLDPRCFRSPHTTRSGPTHSQEKPASECAAYASISCTARRLMNTKEMRPMNLNSATRRNIFCCFGEVVNWHPGTDALRSKLR